MGNLDLSTSGAIGIVLAAGMGSRFGSEKPKQFHNLAGRMIVEYPLQTFLEHDEISEVILVHPANQDVIVDELRRRYAGAKPLHFVCGGTSRAGSTRSALESIPEGGLGRRKVLLHDAARPFLTSEIIDRCLRALETYEAVDTVVAAVDTIVELDPNSEWLQSVPQRSRLRRGQTPQGFWLDRISAAYADMDDMSLSRFTDDCGVLLSRFPDLQIAAVDGHENNIKITSPLDMFVAEQILYMGFARRSDLATPTVKDAVAVLFGGTSGLGLACAERLTSLGWNVEVASRATGQDIRDLNAVRSYLQSVRDKHGRIDLVGNFAGILHVGRLDGMNLEIVDEILSVNLMGSIVVSQASLPFLSETRGHLVLTSSSSYYRGRADTAAYSASKAAVVNLTQALAEEWAPQGVTVTCIVPRRADTPMRRKAFPQEDQTANLSPELVADALVELYNKGQTGIIRHVY